MGCISSYLAVAATTSAVITSSSSYGYRTSNLRRQQAERTSTANTTASSRSSTSKPPISASAANPQTPARQGSSQIFTISSNTLTQTPLVNETAIKTTSPKKEQNELPTRKLSSVTKPTASSTAHQAKTKTQSSANISTKSTPQVRSRVVPVTSSDKKTRSELCKSSVLLSKSFAKTSKPQCKPTHGWKSAQHATHTLASVSPTTATSSSSKSPFSTTSFTEVQPNSASKNLNSTDNDVISIDQLLGMRIDSAKLRKILDRKKSLSESSNASGKTNVLVKSYAHDHLDIAKLKKEMLSSNYASTDASWEYAVDANHCLYKKAPESNKDKFLTLLQDDEPFQKDLTYGKNNINKTKLNNIVYHDQKSFHKSQRSIFSHGSATSYPLSQFSQITNMSSVSNSHHNNKQISLTHQDSFELPHETVPKHYLELIKAPNLRQYQNDSMNNQFIPSTTTSTDSAKVRKHQHLNALEQTHSELHESLNLELISQVHSYDSELQRKYSQVSQSFKTPVVSETIHLPPLNTQRRQSDLSNVRNHRPSLADRQRRLRKSQTLPNMAFDEEESVLSGENLIHPFSPDNVHSSEYTVFSPQNEDRNEIANENNQRRLSTPKRDTSRPITSEIYSTASSQVFSVSQTGMRPKLNIKANIRSKSPSLMSSKMSNRFESLLRHKSFLKTAASRVSSFAGEGRSSRRGSEFSTFAGTSHKAMQIISDHSSGVNCLELSEDRSLLVSGGEDGVLRLWSTFSSPCECIGILVGHQGYITCCAVYRLMVISGSADRTLKLWSIEDGSCLMTLSGHTAFINRIACYGPLLVSTSFDGTARIWTLVERLTVMNNLKNEGASLELEELPDEDVDENQEKVLEKWKGNTSVNLVQRQTVRTTFGGCLHILKGHERSVTQVAMMVPDLSLLETGIIQELDIVVTTSADGTARTWSLATGEQRHILTGHSGPVNCMSVDPKETQYVYTAGADWVIKCWDVITGEHLRDLKGHQNAVLCLVSHNRILYSGSADNTVRAWAMEFGQCTRIYYRNTSAITCIQYFNGIVYTGSNDNSARLYDSNSGVLKQTFTGHQNAISALKVVSGKLFTASFDGKILVWNCDQVQQEMEAAGSSLTGQGTNNQGRNSISYSQSLPRRHSNKNSKSKSGTLKKKQPVIGASILNHTLKLFPGGGTGREQHSREALYPQLRKGSSTDLAVNGAIERVLTGKKKRFRQQQSLNNRRKSSTCSSTQSSSCFSSQIWPEKLRSLSLSLSSLAKSHSSCWSSRTRKHLGRKTKVHQFKPRDQVAGHGRQDQGGTLNHSIRNLIESKHSLGNRNQQKGAKEASGNVPADSANVQRAIDALEPYLRSFK